MWRFLPGDSNAQAAFDQPQPEPLLRLRNDAGGRRAPCRAQDTGRRPASLVDGSSEPKNRAAASRRSADGEAAVRDPRPLRSARLSPHVAPASVVPVLSCRLTGLCRRITAPHRHGHLTRCTVLRLRRTACRPGPASSERPSLRRDGTPRVALLGPPRLGRRHRHARGTGPNSSLHRSAASSAKAAAPASARSSDWPATIGPSAATAASSSSARRPRAVPIAGQIRALQASYQVLLSQATDPDTIENRRRQLRAAVARACDALAAPEAIPAAKWKGSGRLVCVRCHSHGSASMRPLLSRRAQASRTATISPVI